jgi:hypothetical protein
VVRSGKVAMARSVQLRNSNHRTRRDNQEQEK